MIRNEVYKNSGRETSAEVQQLFDKMTTFVVDYLNNAETITNSAEPVDRALHVQSLLSHICDYVLQVEYCDDFSEQIETMRENLFNL